MVGGGGGGNLANANQVATANRARNNITFRRRLQKLPGGRMQYWHTLRDELTHNENFMSNEWFAQLRQNILQRPGLDEFSRQMVPAIIKKKVPPKQVGKFCRDHLGMIFGKNVWAASGYRLFEIGTGGQSLRIWHHIAHEHNMLGKFTIPVPTND